MRTLQTSLLVASIAFGGFLSSCTARPNETAGIRLSKGADLDAAIGKRVTVTGTSQNGKIGMFLLIDNVPVYLTVKGEPFDIAHPVRITASGTLSRKDYSESLFEGVSGVSVPVGPVYFLELLPE